MKIHHTLHHRSLLKGAALFLALLLAPAPGSAQADVAGYSSDYDYPETAGYEGSYSYVRTLEGSATLIQGDTGDRQALQTNQPVLVGDRIWVAPRGRAEVVLSDRNLIRIDGDSEVIFEALAASPDRQDRNTVLRLPQGNVQLVVVRDFLGEGLPRLDTPNLTVYPQDFGSYRITADGGDWSEVVARDGSAELVTRDGSLLVRAGEEAIVEGDHRPRESVRRASREDSLELWGRRLDSEARYAASYVDDSLRYEAAPLDRYGSWVSVEGRHAWRPRVAVEWRPYWNGRWSFSPLGLTWVSNEPWGWVPYHYGSWDYLPHYGWVWFPGHRFAPAWVYWTWTDHYAGWVPVGYYLRHYHPFWPHHGFRFGTYGWAGGHWSHYDRWTFCSTRYIGHHDQHRWVRDHDRFGRENRLAVPRQGIVTTDTRGLTRTAVQRSEGIVEAIRSRRADARGELPDVTSFVARRQDLSEEVRGRILVDRRTSAVADRTSGRAESIMVPYDAQARSSRAITERPAVRDAAGRTISSAPERVARPSELGGERTAPAAVTRPDVRPEPERSGESWRAPDRSTREAAPRAPEARAPETRAPEARAPEPSRIEGRSPARVEPRPSPPPSRVEARPAERPRQVEPEPPSRDARSIDASSWRDRRTAAPALPERSREAVSDRFSVPRRVIEGVRNNSQGSTPFRPEALPERVEPRTDPRIDPRSAPRIDPRTVRPEPPRVDPRVEARPQPVPERTVDPRRYEPSPSARPPSPPPARVESAPSRSRPSPPPPSYSAPSRGDSRSSAVSSRAPSRSSVSSRAPSRSSSSRSSSSGRAARSRERPPDG